MLFIDEEFFWYIIEFVIKTFREMKILEKYLLRTEEERKNVSEEKLGEYVKILSEMINCKTVFTENGENAKEYEKLYSVIDKAFPNIREKAERLTFGKGCFVYIIKGKNAKKNIMLMSHHDVVEGGEGWESDPFSATEKDGCLFGRGTIDTKTSIFAELAAAEELLSEGYDFEGINLYIGSSNNEETSGDGMVLATEYFKENGIYFDTVLDEGGAITEGMIPGVKCKSAMVAVHEKSRHVFRCRAEVSSKGHTSLNGSSTSSVEAIGKFVAEVSKKAPKIYKGNFYPEVKATFERHVPYMAFPMNVLFGNIGLFSPIIKKIMMGIPAASAMLSTGMFFTTASSGPDRNIQIRDKEAEVTLMLRCVREEDLYRGLEEIKAIGKKHGVEVEEIYHDYCRPTDFNGKAFALVEKLLHQNFPDVAVAPFLLTAATDARRFTDVAENIIRFAPVDLDKKQFPSIHGANENIRINNIGECVLFYKDFIKMV